jgi:hypothetical protein
MARFYSNENFFYAAVEELQKLGHDVLTSKSAGNANKGIPDDEVLAYAVREKRTVVTFNCGHFKRLHRLFPNHYGIIICSEDKNCPALAKRIHEAVENAGSLDCKLIRINRPNPSNKS